MATYFITTLIFALILIYCQYRYHKLKHRYHKVKKELAVLRKAHEEITGEVVRINNDAVQPDLQDDLTGLPERKVFEDRLQQAINQSGRKKAMFAVMAVDVDNFKDIDKLGRDVGDKLLKELSTRLQMSIRQVDTVTRFAGGYFLFLLPHLARAETAIYVAQRIQDNLLHSFKIDQHEIKVTMSIGIAVYPLDGIDIETLLKNADAALKLAKSSGKSKYQFNQSDLHYLGEREITLAMAIRSPNILKNLQIQYKPYFNVDTNDIFFVQAVPHLHDAKLGMVPFTQFANIAENSGKMLEISEWLLKNALTKYQHWHQDGFKPTMLAIPVALRQLENPHFLYMIQSVLQTLNVNNTKLVLDIYDDKLPQNFLFIENLFTQLSESGIQIAIGVIALGHFTMQKINKIPLHYLKIDSRLIESVSQFEDKAVILNKIIELANDEHITVMAEGVDNDGLKNRMRKMGCHIMEGKVFGYLMPTGSVLEVES